MDFINILSEKFWNKNVWLPPNVTWDDFKPNDRYIYTDHRHIIYPIPLAFLILLIRFSLEKYWLSPIGISLGIKKSKPRRAPYNEVLETAYHPKEKLSHKQISALAKQLGWADRKVERWLRVRRSQDKPTTLVKFCENSWRCIYYSSSFCYGLIVLWDKPWLWDIRHCWVGYPLEQSLTSDIWWYYMVSMAFYWSLCVSQFFDVKRKDFWQMFIHHIATILLMAFSWVCNLYRIGTLVLVIHDCADIFLEAAKVAKYAKYQCLCNWIFGIFTLLWIVTRTGIYPFWILKSTTITAPGMLPIFPAYYIFNSLLILLLVLHIVWTYLILKLAYNSVIVGQTLIRLLPSFIVNIGWPMAMAVVYKCGLYMGVYFFSDMEVQKPGCGLYMGAGYLRTNTMDGDIRSSSSEELSDSSGSFAAKDSKDSKDSKESHNSKDGKDL